jgi:hypothetical protein
MIFNENSGLVRIWVRHIQSGQSTMDDVPDLANLRDVVAGLIGTE